LDEACEILRTNEGISKSAEELRALASEFPPRPRRRREGEDALDALSVSATEAVEAVALAGERAVRAGQIGAALERVTAGLSTEDRLVLKMRFADGFTVVEIAASLHVAEKKLYKRLDRILLGLRRSLEDEGIGSEEVAEIISGGAWVGGVGLEGPAANPGGRSVYP
jgi:RNA polymerase sigma factor for flagellar operon FliA